MSNTVPSIYATNIPGAFDSRPDYKRTIYLDVVNVNNGNATNIFQIMGDGWLMWQGLVNADQDIIVVASPCAEAIYNNLIPHQFDRIIIGGDSGNSTDQGSGSIYICGDHTWFVYGQGNDKLNWRMCFVPSKSNNLSQDKLVNIIPNGSITTFNSYPAYGKVSDCIKRVSGYQLDFDNLGTIIKNNPLDFTKFPDHAGMANLVSQYKGFNTSHQPNPRPYIHEPSILPVSTKGYTLTGYTTLTDTGSDGIVRRINRYWYCTGNSYTGTQNAWNERRVKDVSGDLNAPLNGNNLLLIENVVTPATGVVQSSKWRAIYQYNWLERALVNSNGSYCRWYNHSVGSKMTVCMNRAVQMGDEGRWVRHSESQMWRIDHVELGATSGVTFTYTPFNFTGNNTSCTMTEAAPVTVANNSTVRRIYNYDPVDNPHPYTWTFPHRWIFQSDGYFTDQDGKQYYTYIWAFKHHWVAISPIIEWNAGTDLTRNANNVVGPSEFVDHLNFSGSWQVLHSMADTGIDTVGSYLHDQRFEMSKSGDTVGFRVLKTLPDNSPYVQGEEISYTFVTFRMDASAGNTTINNGWGKHPLAATIIPEGSDDTGGTTGGSTEDPTGGTTGGSDGSTEDPTGGSNGSNEDPVV